MVKKIDNRLTEAVQKGFQKKQNEQKKQYDAQRAKQEAHEKEIKKFLPKARKWVDEVLFKKIAAEEARGYNTLVLGRYEDGIPTEAIFKVVQKIDGLKIWAQEDVTWEDNDYGKVFQTQYHIEWKSADPNRNRNDR